MLLRVVMIICCTWTVQERDPEFETVPHCKRTAWAFLFGEWP